MIHILVDVDGIIWKAATTATTEMQGRIAFDVILNSYLRYLGGAKSYDDEAKPDPSTVFFPGHCEVSLYLTADNKSNYRYSLPSPQPYKGNRVGRNKPELFYQIKEYALSRGATLADGCEADDLIATDATLYGKNAVIVSTDKDFRQVANCWHWECKKDFRPYFVEDPGYLVLMKGKGRTKTVFGTAKKWFYYQCIAGDTADHVKGVPGLGPVKAYEYLKDCNTEIEMWNAVVKAYEDNDVSVEKAIQNGRLLFLRRGDDAPLWSPPW